MVSGKHRNDVISKISKRAKKVLDPNLDLETAEANCTKPGPI